MKSRTMSVYGIACLIIAAVFVYTPALNGPFLFDDLTFIVHNPELEKDITLRTVIDASRGQRSRLFGFLTIFWNYKVNGLDPLGYHLVNLMLHLAAALMVWQLCRIIFSTPGVENSPPREWVAFAAAVLFALHPIQTQAVSYISQRFTVLATLLYVSALVLYLHARMNVRKPAEQAYYFAGAVLCGIFGLFTKEIILTLPLAVLLMEKFVVRKNNMPVRWNAVAFFLTAAVLGLVFSGKKLFAMMAQPVASESFPGDIFTFWTFMLTQLRVLAKLLSLYAVPLNLTFDYDFPMSHSLFEPAVLGSGAVLAALSAAGLYFRKKYPAVSLGIFWFFITMSVQFIPRANVIWEYKMYLPSVGLSLAVAAGLAAAMKNPRTVTAVFGAVVFVFAFLTYQRNTLYADETKFWRDTVNKSPHKLRAYLNLMEAHYRLKDWPGALSVLNELIKNNPGMKEGYNNRAALLQRMGRTEEALADYAEALKIQPDYITALVNRGNLYRQLGDADRALRDYNRAAGTDSENATVLSNRGALHLQMRNFDDAMDDLDRAIAADPRFAEAYINRGSVYLAMGNLDEALKNYNLSLALGRYHRDALYNRATVYYRTGNIKAALEDVEILLQYWPDWAPARDFHRELR